MTFSFPQKLMVAVIKAFLDVVWIVDRLGDYPQRVALLSAKFVLVLVIISTFIPKTPFNNLATHFSSDAKYISDGLIAYVYGTSPKSNSYYVLGAFTNAYLAKETPVSTARLMNALFALDLPALKEELAVYVLETFTGGNPGPYLSKKSLIPKTSAEAVLAVDTKSGHVLYELNSNEKLAPASTAKLMTALVALDIYSLSEELAVPQLCTLMESQRVGYPKNSVVSVQDLLYGLLVDSGGDSACTLANGKVSQVNFVAAMNSKARSFGMVNTRFANPIGLDGYNFSTASDLYKLAKAAMSQELIRQIVSTKKYFVSTKGNTFSTTVLNTNKLLWEIPETIGVKTGTTHEAGEVLIYEYKSGKKDIVIVVMRSRDRFADTKAVLDWILKSYSWF